MTEDEFATEWARILEAALLPWQIDELVDEIRRQPAWIAIGEDPMEGNMGEPPPMASWRLN